MIGILFVGLKQNDLPRCLDIFEGEGQRGAEVWFEPTVRIPWNSCGLPNKYWASAKKTAQQTPY